MIRPFSTKLSPRSRRNVKPIAKTRVYVFVNIRVLSTASARFFAKIFQNSGFLHPSFFEFYVYYQLIIMSDAAAATPKKVVKAKKPAAKPTHPPVAEMVNAAITTLKDRKGSSLSAIKKYVGATYKVDAVKLAPFIRRYLVKAVTDGKLSQVKGTGASGSFKLAKPAAVEKPKKVVKKPAAKKSPKKAAKKPAAKAKKAKTPKKEKKAKKPAAAKPKKPKAKKAKTPVKKAAKKPAKKAAK